MKEVLTEALADLSVHGRMRMQQPGICNSVSVSVLFVRGLVGHMRFGARTGGALGYWA